MIHEISRKYGGYRDSGIEWIGDIPEHWRIKRIKEVSIINRKSLSEQISKDYEFDYVDISGVTYGERRYLTERLVFSEAPSRARRMVKKGDTLISTVRTYLKAVSYIENNVKDLIASTGFAVITPKQSIYEKYQSYLLTADFIIDEIFALSTGVSYPAINATTIGNLFFLLPPLPEQKAIADYLDRKTAQIDQKIDLLTQKAKHYGQFKQSLINETVTHGLDKTFAMKDSGIEWIGDIPEHWEVKRFSDVAVQNKVKNKGLIEKNLLSLSYGQIIRKDFNTRFGLLPESFETYQVVRSGTVILRLTDLQNDQKSLRVGLAREQGIITSAYLGLCFRRSINPTFAYYLLHVFDLCKVFYWFGGGLRSTMRFDDIKVIPFILPSPSEQKAIADYLDTKTAQIEQIVETINTQIEKLKELRKNLINDAVTGKIKVAQDE